MQIYSFFNKTDFRRKSNKYYVDFKLNTVRRIILNMNIYIKSGAENFSYCPKRKTSEKEIERMKKSKERQSQEKLDKREAQGKTAIIIKKHTEK